MIGATGRVIVCGAVVLIAGGVARSAATEQPAPPAAVVDTEATTASAADAPHLEPVRGPAGGVKLRLGGRHLHVLSREAAAPGLQPHTCTQVDAPGHE